MIILYIVMVIVGIVGLFGMIFKIAMKERVDLLDEMFNNNDISTQTYKKYKKEL